MDWHEYFANIAELVSRKSKDRSTKVGAVIVSENKSILSTGYNGFCRGINDNIDERHKRPAKYEWTEHAERNAIYNAARHGVRLEGSTMYCNWGGAPCADCARAIIQAGIKYVIMTDIPFGNKTTKPKWDKSCGIGETMLKEAGVLMFSIHEISNKSDFILKEEE